MIRRVLVMAAMFLMPFPLVARDARTTDATPRIVSFAALPSSIRPGQSATLLWTTEGAESVMIEPGVGPRALAGSMAVVPLIRTTYTLTVRNGSAVASASAIVNVMSAPSVVVPAVPRPIVQLEGEGGGTTTYVVSNNGGTPTSITIFNAGSFFSQDPAFFTLAPGASQTVTITANALSRGAYDGAVLINATGVPLQLQVPIKVFSAPAAAGVVTAKPVANRVDLSASLFQSQTGSVGFTNSGDAPLYGTLAADAPWLVPQSGLLKIDPGATATFTFTVDQTKVYQTDFGSSIGTLSLFYLSGTSTDPITKVSSVTVVDTIPPAVTANTPAPLGANEVALFVPGAGHVTGTVGTFISDVSILAGPGVSPPSDVIAFYSSIDGSVRKSMNVPLFSSSIALADVVKSVFGGDGQVGTLMIRSAAVEDLLVSTTVFNVSNPAGTCGTAIPLFRSDRAAGPGEKLLLTGLRRDATSHTNLFLQETSGNSATVQTEFLAADGSSLGTRIDVVGPFALAQINNAVPANAVAAELTNTSSTPAKFLAYATPVDDASGDNWSVVDWSRRYGYSGRDTMIVPVAGVLNGANNTFFRTDVAITNTGSTSGSANLRFISRSGEVGDRTINLGARQSTILENVAGNLFGAPNGTVGFLLFTPVAGTFAATSRTYATVAGQPATLGTGVPVFPASAALKAGAVRAIGGIDDATVATVTAGRPATFRTNFGLLETSGNPVRVRVTLKFNYAAGMKMQTSGTASKDYTLSPNQFLMLNGIATEILGAAAFSVLGDLHGIEADFQVIDGSGAVAVFTSSVDNGSGDSILRIE